MQDHERFHNTVANNPDIADYLLKCINLGFLFCKRNRDASLLNQTAMVGSLKRADKYQWIYPGKPHGAKKIL